MLLWTEAYEKHKQLLAQDSVLMFGGEISRKEEGTSLFAHEVFRMEDVPGLFTKQVRLHITAAQVEKSLAKVKEILLMHPGTTPLHVRLIFPTGEKVTIEADSKYNVTASPELVRELEQELGEKTVFTVIDKTPLKYGTPAKKKWKRKAAASQ